MAAPAVDRPKGELPPGGPHRSVHRNPTGEHTMIDIGSPPESAERRARIVFTAYERYA
jgi:hypothetical protein